MKSLELINQIPSTRETIDSLAEAIVNNVMDGNIDPLDVHLKITALERIIKAVKDNDNYRTAVMDQADLYPGNIFDHKGAELTKGNATRYDYSENNYWNKLKETETLAADERKDHEKLLQSLKVATDINGELSYPPVKYATSYVKIKFR